MLCKHLLSVLFYDRFNTLVNFLEVKVIDRLPTTVHVMIVSKTLLHPKKNSAVLYCEPPKIAAKDKNPYNINAPPPLEYNRQNQKL